jgi:hypothetical protein
MKKGMVDEESEEVRLSQNQERRRQETWKAADVLCPFYMKDNPSSIECEGVLDQTTEVLRFHSAIIKNKHMGIYCVVNYTSCPKYQSVYQNKYSD